MNTFPFAILNGSETHKSLLGTFHMAITLELIYRYMIPIVNTTHLVSWTSDKRTHVKAQYCTFIADILISKSMSNFNTCYLYYQNYVLDFLWFAYLTSPCCTWRPIEQRLRINISITCTYLGFVFDFFKRYNLFPKIIVNTCILF